MRRLLIWLIVIVALVVYAYGFQVTQVDLQELGSETRQASLARIMRALARPDFIEYDQEEFIVETPVYIPCPTSGVPEVTIPADGPYMVMTPTCADPESAVSIEGFNFAPNTEGPLNFIPPSGVSLQMGKITTDANGRFALNVELRDRVNEEPQLLRAVTRRSIGSPHLSQNGIDTIDKILETVFMALLATTLGTLLAVPISFFAAQNLMRTVTSPVMSVALSILAGPLGFLAGTNIADWLSSLSQGLSTTLATNIGGLILAPLVVVGVARFALSGNDDDSGNQAGNGLGGSAIKGGLLLVVLISVVLFFYFLADFAIALGLSVATVLGTFAFVGNFITSIGEILRLILIPVAGLIGAGVLINLGGQVGQMIVDRVDPGSGKIINWVLAAAAGATLLALLGAGIQWIYQLNNLNLSLISPAIVGAIGGLLVALRVPYSASLNTGLVIYSVTRTILNALRSIEALIMVIVFAVWVGIGPFAGVLALGLHTIASLAKLYSEQVESIMDGPLEAVLATGANRLQMIIYSVIPQIIPPYISFTMYRWDINVRMSTIIGFAGGGGIGFLLQQNINLLNYRAASAQILAIAIVVSIMDYVSSALRQRVV
ncbi:MAG: ABC transporter permease subunit [Chloroflexota bacterium]